MYNQRPNIDIQSMMYDKASALSKPRGPTPIRKAPVRLTGNKENLINQTNQWVDVYEKDNRQFQNQNMPRVQNLSRKPLISPVRNPFKTQIQCLYADQRNNYKDVRKQKQQENCANHPNKPAQFNIDIQDQCFAYCNKCAAQLASQGFQVRKIQGQGYKTSDNRLVKQVDSHLNRQLPLYPQYEGNAKYQFIIQFLTQLSEVENEQLQNMTKLSMIQSNYQQQIQLTKSFYSQLISFIEQMQEDHLNDLIQENRKQSQIAMIQHDYLRQNVEEIGNIRRDVEQNLKTIVERLQQYDMKNNLGYYKQKVQVYKHKAEEQNQFFNKIISFTPQEYQSKILRVQDFLMQVWNTQNQCSSSQQNVYQTQIDNRGYNLSKNTRNTKPVQMALPIQRKTIQKGQINLQNVAFKSEPNRQQVPLNKKTSNQVLQQTEAKSTAFRKLFDEEQDQIAQTSPQFKKI